MISVSLAMWRSADHWSALPVHAVALLSVMPRASSHAAPRCLCPFGRASRVMSGVRCSRGQAGSRLRAIGRLSVRRTGIAGREACRLMRGADEVVPRFSLVGV